MNHIISFVKAHHRGAHLTQLVLPTDWHDWITITFMRGTGWWVRWSLVETWGLLVDWPLLIFKGGDKMSTNEQIAIIIKQTVNKVNGSDATMQELHQLQDDIMDLVFARGMEMCGTFRLVGFDDVDDDDLYRECVGELESEK